MRYRDRILQPRRHGGVFTIAELVRSQHHQRRILLGYAVQLVHGAEVRLEKPYLCLFLGRLADRAIAG